VNDTSDTRIKNCTVSANALPCGVEGLFTSCSIEIPILPAPSVSANKRPVGGATSGKTGGRRVWRVVVLIPDHRNVPDSTETAKLPVRRDSALLLVAPRQETQQHGARLGALDAAFLDGLEQVLERRPVTQAFLGEIATA